MNSSVWLLPNRLMKQQLDFFCTNRKITYTVSNNIRDMIRFYQLKLVKVYQIVSIYSLKFTEQLIEI